MGLTYAMGVQSTLSVWPADKGRCRPDPGADAGASPRACGATPIIGRSRPRSWRWRLLRRIGGQSSGGKVRTKPCPRASPLCGCDRPRETGSFDTPCARMAPRRMAGGRKRAYGSAVRRLALLLRRGAGLGRVGRVRLRDTGARERLSCSTCASSFSDLRPRRRTASWASRPSPLAMGLEGARLAPIRPSRCPGPLTREAWVRTRASSSSSCSNHLRKSKRQWTGLVTSWHECAFGAPSVWRRRLGFLVCRDDGGGSTRSHHVLAPATGSRAPSSAIARRWKAPIGVRLEMLIVRVDHD